ncbi:cytochrome P450 6B2-like [Leptidea sinapis]|uniref:cytochrome P450 6B2-like n=1 Tax=Leptidea sinapis TaxID=189913 RepID=UPI0021C4BC6B|nr:cytochrome P450 6B2-like [Leptidea sinapis]
MFFVIILCILVFIYVYSSWTFDYWKKKGIKHDPPAPFLGTNSKQFLQKASMSMMAEEMYYKYPKERVVGFFRGRKPELVIRDPEIAKRILVTDFNNFYSRGFVPHKTNIEPLLKNIFFADGDLWKLLRHRFSLVFSTGKIKAMFSIITERAEKLQTLAEKVSEYDSYDAHELMARYTTDFIGACGFGLNIDTLNDETSEFRKLGKRIFVRTPADATRGALKLIFPELCKNLHFLSSELEKSMNYLVHTVLKQRNYETSGKNDFIDLMLELKQKGNMVGESIEEKNPYGSSKTIELELSFDLMIAQVFVFFGAGFETSSTSSSHTLHQLAYHPEIQRKVQEEIDRVLIKYDNKITYDAVNEMNYLEKTFYESLRMYPPVAFLMRESAKKYTFPELDLSIDENMKVIIPIKAIFNDETYFEEPNRFNPDRFQSLKDMKNHIFIPFGDGPRACVGARLGLMQSMAGIAAILHRFDVEPSSESIRNPKTDPTGIVSENFAGGLPLKLRKRKCAM